jgi:hypothetical protein
MIGCCVGPTTQTGEAIELARKGGEPEFLSHADAGRFFALAVESARPDPAAGDPAAVVFLTSRPPPGFPVPVDPEPAFNLCGYRAQDVFPAGLPFPVLDPEHDLGATIDTAALATAWQRVHTLASDPGCTGFTKDGRIVVDVPPDEDETPAPDHRWLGFNYEYCGVRGKESPGEPDVQIGPATRSGIWRSITPNVLELPSRERRWRLYYTRSGPTRDYNTPAGQPNSPGCVLSALSDDGTVWHPVSSAGHPPASLPVLQHPPNRLHTCCSPRISHGSAAAAAAVAAAADAGAGGRGTLAASQGWCLTEGHLSGCRAVAAHAATWIPHVLRGTEQQRPKHCPFRGLVRWQSLRA